MKTLRSLSSIVGASAVLLMTGCAGRQEARNVARLTLQQATRMDQQLQEKIQAESEFYLKRRETLVNSANESLQVDLLTFLVVQADDAASKITASPGAPDLSGIRDILKGMATEWELQRTSELSEIQSLSAASAQAVTKLSAKALELGELRKKIEALQSEDKPAANARELYQFYKSIESALNSTNKVSN